MAVEYFLKFNTLIEGESVVPGFEKAIAIHSWSWGAIQTSTVQGTGGSGAGKVSYSDVSFMCDFDKATTEMLKGINNGTHYATAILSAVKSGAKNKPYLVLTMNEIFLTQVQMSASSEIPTVSMSLTFKNYTMDYKIQDKDGNLQTGGEASWDLTKNDEK